MVAIILPSLGLIIETKKSSKKRRRIRRFEESWNTKRWSLSIGLDLWRGGQDRQQLLDRFSRLSLPWRKWRWRIC